MAYETKYKQLLKRAIIKQGSIPREKQGVSKQLSVHKYAQIRHDRNCS